MLENSRNLAAVPDATRHFMIAKCHISPNYPILRLIIRAQMRLLSRSVLVTTVFAISLFKLDVLRKQNQKKKKNRVLISNVNKQ